MINQLQLQKKIEAEIEVMNHEKKEAVEANDRPVFLEAKTKSITEKTTDSKVETIETIIDETASENVEKEVENDVITNTEEVTPNNLNKFTITSGHYKEWLLFIEE